MITRKNERCHDVTNAVTFFHGGFGLTPLCLFSKVRNVRTALHLLCFVFLWFLLKDAWNHQFEAAPGGETVSLHQLNWLTPPEDHIQHDPSAIEISATAPVRHATLGLPFACKSDYLFIRITARAKNLLPGNEIWQDGRIFLEWLTPDNRRAAVTPIHSARGNSQASLRFAVKVPPGNLRPVLQMQNLGKQGEYQVQKIELTPAHHTNLWKWGSTLISVATIFLVSSLLAIHSPHPWHRRLLASCITILFAYLFIIPGPWPKRVGMGQSLHWPPTPSMGATTPPLTNQPTARALTKKLTDHQAPSTLPVAAQYTKLPEPDNLALRAKKALKKIRPLLHVALLFLPVLLVSFCVGAKPGFLLGLAMAIGIESAQWLFGYGFHTDDVWDLLSNLCGISLAVFCYLRPWRRDWKSLVSSRHEASL